MMVFRIFKLIFVSSIVVLFPIGASHADKQFIGCPGENYTVSWGINVSEQICVKMYNYMTGKSTVAKFWNNSLVGKKNLGQHTGSACFQLAGL